MINLYYIYIFRVKKDGRVIYVGSSRTIGARINEHRRGMREKRREQPIHTYLLLNNIKLIKDVEISIIDTARTKKESLEKESYYYDLYQKTIANIWRAEEREGKKSPVRQPLKLKGREVFFESQREAADKLGISRYSVRKMLEKGELELVNLKYKYLNESTGEKFISGYQLQKRYNLDTKTVNNLSKSGTLILNGMKIKKV